jgi:O-succinylbenzoic acid--CoA ligase
MASQICTTPPSSEPDHLRTAGYVLPHRELRISPGGEILVRGATLFDGYLSRRGLDRPLLHGGWFATGDLGHVDLEGRLVVRGRKDTMFVSGGENVYPEEIESQIERLAGVRRALVVPVDDPEFGQRPVAFVQRDAESGTPEEWTAELRKHLPGFKIPDRFLLWPEEFGDAANPDRTVFAERALELAR